MKPEDIAKNSEYSQQCALFCWAAANTKRYPELKYMYANFLNAGGGDAVRGNRARAAGVKKGVLDIFLPVKRSCYCGLYIEMKYGCNKLTDEQIDFANFVFAQGYRVVVCYNWQVASEQIEQYLLQ